LLSYRNLFSIPEGTVYLNNAAGSPLNTPAQRALEDYLVLASEAPHNKPSVRETVREALVELFGGHSSDYALVTSTGLGIGMVAAGYDWKSGDNVVLPADEHWNSTFPWLALQDRGVEVRLISPDDSGRVSIEEIASSIDQNTRIVSVNAVRFDNGFRLGLRKLGEIVHARNALLVVDGTQAAGAVPINVIDDGIDVLCCAGFKWLLGMSGTGFLYVNSHAREKIRPVLPGMFAAEHNMREINFHDDARQYETGSIAYSLFHAWISGLRVLEEIGIENIATRNTELTDQIISGLDAKGMTVISPVEFDEERSAIVVFTTGCPDANKTLVDKLLENNIVVSLRGGCIRVSPNFYNTTSDVDKFLKML